MSTPSWANYEGLKAPPCVTCCEPRGPACGCSMLLEPYIADFNDGIAALAASVRACGIGFFPLAVAPVVGDYATLTGRSASVAAGVVSASQSTSNTLPAPFSEPFGISINNVTIKFIADLVEGDVLTASVSASITGDFKTGGLGGITVFVEEACGGDGYVEYAGGDASGTLDPIPATGPYIITLLAGIGEFPDGSTGEFAITASTITLSISTSNPAGIWPGEIYGVMGTPPRTVEACPRLRLPPLTEATGVWYADEAAATAALADLVSNCAGYSDRTDIAFGATDGGSSLTLAGQDDGIDPLFTMWGSVNVEPGETLSAAFTITNPHAAATARLRIYDAAGVLLETLTSTSATGTLTSAVLAGGRYTAEVQGGRTDGAATDMLTASFVLTATGTMTVNPVVALWDDGENCPRRKECA
jgi:hypothetical protein